MSRHPVIIDASYTQGTEAYRAGTTLRNIIKTLGEIDLRHEQPDLSNEQHEEIVNSGQSLIAGFADGLIDDIRNIASARRGQRA